ncbi:MAG: NAD(P)/FAD-dependent oxidoreductase [Pseudomonadales bacterium]|nr:NAD(P)/FAD-dependent oxidoreductase [Pseudomonadales bacterium]
MSEKFKRDPSVVIIGAGMTGILMAIKFREAGITDVTILEKADKIGGTWRENRYPGVACDVPSHMYSYSFEPNPEWSRRFSPGSETQAYFEKVVRKYGVEDVIRFNEAVTDASYDQGRWSIKTSKKKNLEADFLISATGILHHPAKPEIKGLSSFKGSSFHTAEWEDGIDLTGKRVGIIGTGSTSVQMTCELSQTVGKLSIFQRTPQWVLPIVDRTYSEKTKQRLRDYPFLGGLVGQGYKLSLEKLLSNAVIGAKVPHAVMTAACKYNLSTVKDPVLRKKLTPDYKVGCKRIIMSDSFYEAMQRPTVDLVTEGIECVNETGIRTADGQQHDLDVIIIATGFHPFSFMRPMNLKGKGVEIEETWKKKVQAYRSICLPDYPNFFLMLGPNTPIGNFSVIAMSEVQTKYILKLIDKWRDEQFDEVSATKPALERFNAYLKKGMPKTVWVSGCQSWYLDPDGDPASWPYPWKQWVKEMNEPDMRDFEVAKCEAPAPKPKKVRKKKSPAAAES